MRTKVDHKSNNECNPLVGQIVSISSIKYSSLGPLNPKIERVREDVEWEDVTNCEFTRNNDDHPIIQTGNHYRQAPGFWQMQVNIFNK